MLSVQLDLYCSFVHKIMFLGGATMFLKRMSVVLIAAVFMVSLFEIAKAGNDYQFEVIIGVVVKKPGEAPKWTKHVFKVRARSHTEAKKKGTNSLITFMRQRKLGPMAMETLKATSKQITFHWYIRYIKCTEVCHNNGFANVCSCDWGRCGNVQVSNAIEARSENEAFNKISGKCKILKGSSRGYAPL